MGVPLSRRQLQSKYEPHTDFGFFGPGSVTWKVWSYPTSFVLGFVRAVTIEHFDPHLAAAVIQSGGVRYRPSNRYSRTLRYFAMVMFGDAERTAKAADVLVKVHSKAIGRDPVTRSNYDANDGDSQLWIHMTAWHSILLCYERFGPGRLTESEETQFWGECREAAKLQTIDPSKVPANRDDVRRYFDECRPKLAASEGAQEMIQFILKMDVALPEGTSWLRRALAAPFLWVARKAVISTYPHYMRELAGIRQSKITDWAVVTPTRVAHWLLSRVAPLLFFVGEIVAPSALEIAAPVLLGIKPTTEKVWGVEEAQQFFGYQVPAEAHLDVRGRQRDRVFVSGVKPSDAGLAESQELIGKISDGGISYDEALA